LEGAEANGSEIFARPDTLQKDVIGSTDFFFLDPLTFFAMFAILDRWGRKEQPTVVYYYYIATTVYCLLFTVYCMTDCY
jgi:hypothetical protein